MEFTDVYQMGDELEAKLAGEFDRMIAAVTSHAVGSR